MHQPMKLIDMANEASDTGEETNSAKRTIQVSPGTSPAKKRLKNRSERREIGYNYFDVDQQGKLVGSGWP